MTVKTSTELTAFSAALSTGRLDFASFVEQSMRTLSRLMDCDRAGVWCISGRGPDRVLHCVGVYDRTLRRQTRVEDMGEPQITAYVDAVISAGMVDAVDVRTHPATRAFFESGGLHAGVSSVLAKTFLLNGELLGIFTCAQFEGGAEFGSRRLAALQKFSSEFVLAIARNCHPPSAMLCGLPPSEERDKAY